MVEYLPRLFENRILSKCSTSISQRSEKNRFFVINIPFDVQVEWAFQGATAQRAESNGNVEWDVEWRNCASKSNGNAAIFLKTVVAGRSRPNL